MACAPYHAMAMYVLQCMNCQVCDRGPSAYLGKPACWARSASMTAAPGSFSDGFSTKVLPAVTATGNIHKGIMAGKLNGQMPAHTYSQHA